MAWEPTADLDHHFEMTLPNTPAGAALARRQLVRFVEHVCLNRGAVGDLETAIGEALANAAEHGYRSGGRIHVTAHLTGDGIEIEVSDDGRGFAPRVVPVDHPPALAPRGYGIFLMRAMVDEVDFADDGRTVRFLKRF